MKNLFLIFLIIFGNELFSQNYYVYVAAESDDVVSLIKFDGEISEEIDRIDVGIMPTEIEGPHGITIDPNGKYWYLSLAHGNPFGSLVKYSTETNKPISSTKLGLFPASMQISPITGLLYCVNFNLHGDMKPSTVSVVDPESMTEITQVKTGSMPHGSRISNDGLFQYSVAMMSGELFEIDAISLKVSRVLDLESKMDNGNHMMNHSMNKKENMTMKHSKTQPTWVIPHPIKNLLYIAGNGSDEIFVVDLESFSVEDKLSTGKGPYNLAISPDGKTLLATLKSEGAVSIWSLKNNKLLKKIKNTTNIPHGVVISPDNKYAFVSVEGVGGEPGKVDVINLETLSLQGSINVGKQAGGIAFWKIEQ